MLFQTFFLIVPPVIILVTVLIALAGSKSRDYHLIGGFKSHRLSSVLLVIAHPDDESMFFVPTVRALRESNVKVHILCLSAGNAEGLGEIRKRELRNAAMGVLELSSMEIIDDEIHLADGMNTKWDLDVVSSHVQDKVRELLIDAVVTFDSKGVSSHPNHISCCFGCRLALREPQFTNIHLYELKSTPFWRKYLGPVSIIFEIFLTNSSSFIVWRPDLVLANAAMTAHYSQYVWFRSLFIIFSSFTYFNGLEHVPTH